MFNQVLRTPTLYVFRLQNSATKSEILRKSLCQVVGHSQFRDVSL